MKAKNKIQNQKQNVITKQNKENLEEVKKE